MSTAICLTGYPGAGKSTEEIVDCAETHNVPVLSMGDAVRAKAGERIPEKIEQAKSGEIEKTVKQVYGDFADKMRDEYGDQIVAEWTAEMVQNADSNVVVIDGLRAPEGQETLAEILDRVIVAFVYAPAYMRYERTKSRGRGGEDEITLEEFIEQDQLQGSWGLEDVIQDADVTLYNCGELSSYVSQFENLLLEHL